MEQRYLVEITFFEPGNAILQTKRFSVNAESASSARDFAVMQLRLTNHNINIQRVRVEDPPPPPRTNDEIQRLLRQLYQQLLERDPDFPGSDMWSRMLRSRSQSIRDIVRGFALSEEFKNRYLNDDIAKGVQRLYERLLGREPDPVGFAHFSVIASSSGYLPVIDGILNSGEYAREFGSDHVPFLRPHQ